MHIEDKSEREFSLQIDPGLAIVNESIRPASRPALYRDAHDEAGHEPELTQRPRRAGDRALQSGAFRRRHASRQLASSAEHPLPRGATSSTSRHGRQPSATDVHAHRPPALEREIAVRTAVGRLLARSDSPREEPSLRRAVPARTRGSLALWGSARRTSPSNAALAVGISGTSVRLPGQLRVLRHRDGRRGARRRRRVAG